MCGGHLQCFSHTGFAPTHGMCAFPIYTAQAPGCSTWAGPELCALPRSKPLRFRFLGIPQRHRLSWACVLCLPRQEQLRQPEAWWTPSLQVQCALSPPWSQPQFPVRWFGACCVSSGELISDCDPPSRCQPSRISGSLWLETGGLFEVW